MKKILLLYIPAIHQGYLKLFERQKEGVDGLVIVGSGLIKEFFKLHEEIRAIDPGTAWNIISKMDIFKEVLIFDPVNLPGSKGTPINIITTREIIHEKVIAKYFPKAKVTFDNTFLRWDERSIFSQTSVNYDVISRSKKDLTIINKAAAKGEESADWWRRVGVAIVKKGKIIMMHYNHHVPHQQISYICGDPRDFIKAGESPEISTAFHAEAALIAQAANKGIPLRGLSLYTTVFPCPACAKLIAKAGIKKCYFAAGHASLDGESILKINKVKLIKVEEPLKK